MKKRVTEYHFASLAALLLFGVFAVCVAMVLLIGVDAYRRLVTRDETVHDRSISMQYVAMRVRQAEGPDCIRTEEFGGVNALALTDSAGCITRVYYYDGHIMELYTDADNVLSPAAGEQVMEAGGLDFSLNDGLLTVTAIDPEGEQSILRLFIHSRGEAGT
ncbi:MAG: DUF4860 domain-containing protein [Lachnospiraceae bacterium]|nr:DUF4860 domain-containing protein [Lachnospiraceae bacterium]